MNIRAVIVDDEYLSIEELIFLLSKTSNVEVVGKADCGIDGLRLIKELKPDLVFLDVRMPDITGIQLSKEINKLNFKCNIIFTTAYDQYALKAFDVDAIDYILKPFEEKRVLKAVSKVKNILQNENIIHSKIISNNICFNKLPVLKDDKLILLDIENILMIYTENRNIFIKTVSETFTSSSPLQELEERLCDKGFFRTHRSYLVNLNKIREVSPWFNGAYVAILEGLDEEIPISRNQVKVFKQIFGI